MTDNVIIKALECCSADRKTCEDCPYNGQATAEKFCDEKLQADALALINRQKAEIERLEELVYLAENETANVRDLYFAENRERAEAIKEFAERLKAKRGTRGEIWDSDIDNLVKEMVGADNAE